MIFVPVLYSLSLSHPLSLSLALALSCVVFFRMILSQFSSPVCNKNEEKIEASQSARIRLNKTNKVIAKCACFYPRFSFPDPCYNFVFCICNSVVHAPVSAAAFCSIFFLCWSGKPNLKIAFNCDNLSDWNSSDVLKIRLTVCVCAVRLALSLSPRNAFV